MSRDSMIFYRSFYESLKDLPSETKAEVYDAIFSYSLDFNENSLSGISKSIFILIKPQLDANLKRYENGKKPKRNQSESKIEAKDNQNLTGNEPKDNQNDNKTVTNVNVNDNYNDNENYNQNVNDKVLLIKETKPKKSIDDRKLEFRDKVHEIMIVEDIDKNIVKDFYLYWTEPNQSKTKMRFELEKTYDISRRLGTWVKNNEKFSNSKIISNGPKETRTDSQNTAKEQFRRNFNK